MAGTTQKSIGSFALEVATSDHVRIFTELPGQRFAVSLVPKKLAKEMPEKPITPAVQFDFQDVMRLAALAFTGDQRAGEDKDARIKLSGMVIYLAQQIGALDL